MTRRRFDFIDSGSRPGDWNMRYDVRRAELLSDASTASGTGPSVRVYGWNPWCISLGRHQSEQDIDHGRVDAAGYEVVRRPTGGRAILHAEELTYSVIMPSDGRGIMEVYRSISEALTAGLQTLVPEIDISRSQPNFRKLYREAGSIPCFSSSARYEIEFGGKKLVGSAQRRIGGAVLQHGSILIGEAHLGLADFLAVDETQRQQLREDMRAHTITLQEILRRPVSFEEVSLAVKTGFEKTWDLDFSILSENEYIPDETDL